MLEEYTIEHGEDGLLLGLGEAGEALELALELGGGPALAGLRADDAEEARGLGRRLLAHGRHAEQLIGGDAKAGRGA